MTVQRRGHTRVTKNGTVARVQPHRMKGNPAEAPQRVPRAPHREKLSLVRDASISGTAGLLAGSLARLVLVLPLAIVVTLVTVLSTLIALQMRALGGGKKRRRVKRSVKVKRWAKRKGKLAAIATARWVRGRENRRASLDPAPLPTGGAKDRAITDSWAPTSEMARFMKGKAPKTMAELMDARNEFTLKTSKYRAGMGPKP